MIWIILFGILIVSFVMALMSLRELLRKHPEITQVSNELSKGKILYQRDSSVVSPESETS